MTKTPAAKDPTRNVWLQLGFPDAEEHFLKAELVLRLDKAINSLRLTQRARRKIHRSFPRTADALSDRARLSRNGAACRGMHCDMR